MKAAQDTRTCHWLTIVNSAAACDECGESLEIGADLVYRHDPRELLCKPCADKCGLAYRSSKKWEKQQRRQASASTASRDLRAELQASSDVLCARVRAEREAT